MFSSLFGKIIATKVIIVLIKIVLFVIYRTVCGFIADSIAEKRELKNKGFGWGFLLGIFGIVIMRCCPRDDEPK